MFRGCLVALVTPMSPSGSIDDTSLRQLVEHHISAGVDGIVLLGTTGESATLTADEREHVIRTVVKQVKGRLPIIVGSSANGTLQTIELTKQAMNLGADACLVMTPSYIKPTQEGLLQHFSTIANEVPIPLILYNNPGRTACDMEPETVARLAKIPNIVGIKEASGSLAHAQKILSLCGDSLDVFSGDDDLTLEMMKLGAKGVISTTANVAPHLVQELCDAVLNGDLHVATSLNKKLQGLYKQLFVESNPIPVKWALSHLGLIPQGIRLPLTALSEEHQGSVVSALAQAELV